MGVDYVVDRENERSCMYCNTTQRAFGPVFEGADHEAALAAFVAALPDDPRAFSDDKLTEMAEAFVRAMNEEDDAAAREAQAAREAAADMIETQPAPPLSPNHPAMGNLTPEEFDESGYDGPMVPPQSDEPPPPQPADTDVSTPATPEVPYGRRVCWNCNGSGREFVGQAEAPCGICDGVGHLPAA